LKRGSSARPKSDGHCSSKAMAMMLRLTWIFLALEVLVVDPDDLVMS
jgi:hypothetical protein